jgi:hypothetical protein
MFIKKMVSLSMAIASRGLSNNKVDLITKKLRVLSCFGHGEIPPCQNLKKSKTSDFYYCGSCGCGDSSGTWLLKKEGEYSKLDYPKLNCPIHMPGFSNYDPNNTAGIARRKKIENMDPQELELIQVTVGKSEEHERIMNELNKILKNS